MKILMMSDSWHTISGFGTASRYLAKHLHNSGHDVSYIGWQTFGQKQVASFHDEILGFKGLPNVGGQRFGEQAWQYWLPRVKPDVFLTLADFWMLLSLFKTNELPVAWSMWYPIDGYPMTDQIEQMLRRIDYPVAMSEYGANMTAEKGISTGMVPHGVDKSIYKPYHLKVSGEMKAKIGIPENAFVVGRVDRNQSRKKIPRAIKAFVEFHKDFPDSVLYLHMDKRDTEGWDLTYILKRFGLEEGKNVFFPPPDMMANFMYGLAPEELAQVMNIIDIHLWTTGGEGFGLTGLETMACGAVNVATDYTTPPEIFQFGKKDACGLPIRVETFEVGNAGVDRSLIDVGHAYEQMKWLRENPDEMKVMRDNGLKRSTKVYDWSVVGTSYDKYLRDNI